MAERTDWLTLDQTYLLPTYNRLPIAIARAQGNYVYDTEGNAYLDLFTGLAVNVLGHGHPTVLAALREQAEAFLHISNVFLNPPAIRLAQRLVAHTFPGKVFFTNSGAEATEAAIKLVHMWSRRRGGSRAGFVVLKNSFHGRTLGALRLTRQKAVQQDFPTSPVPVYEVEPEDIAQVEAVLRAHRPAAVLVEPVLGSGGVVPLSEGYLQALERLCRAHGALFGVDEIQTGMGRTGTLFAYQQAGVTPDFLLFAKGVGGGLPLGGVIAGKQLADVFAPGDHGSTFAPSPLSAACGNAVLKVLLDDGLMEEGRRVAAYLRERLEALCRAHPDAFDAVRGKGMMLGLPMKWPPGAVRALQRALLRQGFLFDVTQRTIIRLLPPLTLTPGEVDAFVAALDAHVRQGAPDDGQTE